MENFPGGAGLELPTKLSPLVSEPPPNRISRSVISVFASQQEEEAVLKRTEYSLPQCYYRSFLQGASELKLNSSQVGQFSIDSLFYAFYEIPGDVLQAVVAVELHHRGWRYHPELKLWFRQAENGVSTQPIHFDPVKWEQSVFVKAVDQSKFLSSADHMPRFGSNLGVLRTGPQIRLPPGSPHSAAASNPPLIR